MDFRKHIFLNGRPADGFVGGVVKRYGTLSGNYWVLYFTW